MEAPVRPSITTRDLWICPKCGNAFVNRNSSHSCVSVPIDEHFTNRPNARRIFDAFRAAIEAFGPTRIVSSRSRIGFMTRVRFVGCYVRRDYLVAHFWLTYRIKSPRFFKVELIPPVNFLYYIALRHESDIDDELRDWIRQARAIGDQEHLIPGTAAYAQTTRPATSTGRTP